MMTRYSFRISGWVDVDDAKIIPQAKEFRIDKCEVVM